MLKGRCIVPKVRTASIGTALVLGLLAAASAQSQSKPSIAVSFVVDGKPARCTPFGVELSLNGKIIRPNHHGQSFEVPGAFRKSPLHWRDDQRVDISLTCNENIFVFPNLHPALVGQSDWELGMARPPYSMERFRRTDALEHGAWLSYLLFQGEPGVETFVSQPDPPADVADAMLIEQVTASGERKRDIAYALAVFGIDYQTNRDYLLSVLKSCLSRLNGWPEDDECDGDLLDFVTNLYWRGDDALLDVLLEASDTRRDVIGEIGTFYADLLDRRGAIFLDSIRPLLPEQQELICKLASRDDLRHKSPERNRVIAFLKATRSEAATGCLAAL